MDAQHLIQERLKQKLVEAKVKNPRTSVRSFAKQIKVPASTVSLVLLGKRKVSKTLALKISDALQFDPMERMKIASEFDSEAPTKKKRTVSPHEKNKTISKDFKSDGLKLSDEHFDLLKEWYYFGILSLVKTHDFKMDAAWVADRLSIKVVEAKTALDQLVKMKLIEIDTQGKASRAYGGFVRTSDGKSNLSLRHAHQQNLKLAADALQNRALDEFDFTSINLPVDFTKLPEMKLMIREFEAEFIERFAPKEGANEVLRVCVQAFPVTKLRKNSNE